MPDVSMFLIPETGREVIRLRRVIEENYPLHSPAIGKQAKQRGHKAKAASEQLEKFFEGKVVEVFGASALDELRRQAGREAGEKVSEKKETELSAEEVDQLCFTLNNLIREQEQQSSESKGAA